MLAVHGQNRRAVLQGERRNEFARHDERLFVGQCDGFPGFDGRDGGAESGETHHGRHHHIDIRQTRRVANGFGTRPHFNR